MTKIEKLNKYVEELNESGLMNDITDDDIEQAFDYMLNNIPCMDFEKSCGTHIGCSTCPYYKFRMTVAIALQKAL